jgi:hypothetical protein
MKELIVCPNGERITAREKLVGMVLGDSHQDKGDTFTYPSIESIAEDSLCDRRSCQRYLDSLERKGVIRRKRGEIQGRGYRVFYFFPELDKLTKGWQPVALPRAAQEGGEKGGELVAEERGNGGKTEAPCLVRAREPEQEREPEQGKRQTAPPPATETLRAINPDAGEELMAAVWFFEEPGVPSDFGMRNLAAQAIRMQAKEWGGMQPAAERILARARKAKSEGETR